MSFPITCSACGARLKLPPGCTKKKARCPKCNTRMNLTAALDAVSYLPDSVSTIIEPPAPATPAKPGAPPPVEQEDDTLPGTDPHAATSPTAVAELPARPAPPPFEREEDPLPYLDLNPTPRRKSAEPQLTVDDTPPKDAAPPASAAPPFRTPARVTADSAKLFAGPCEVVLVPHGLFLESVPYRPFVYAPLGSKAEPAGRRELAVTLPDGRTLTVEFAGPDAAQISLDAAAFLARERGLPDYREYRRNPKWLFGVALIFALGLSVGPIVLSQTTDLGVRTGLLIGAGFAVAGLLANAAVVLLTRLSVPGKVVIMTTVGVLVTGVFLFAATAYLAGRKHEAAQVKPDPPPPELPPPKPPDPSDRRRGLPTAVDVAYREGFYRLDAGPSDVTAIGVTSDGAVMLVGYANGATQSWRFDNITDDEFAPGPRGDGPVTRIRFGATGAVAYLTCDGGTVAAYWNTPPEVPVKIPGEPFAAHTFPGGERFAAYRPGALPLRHVPVDRLKGGKIDPKAREPKRFITLTPKDEPEPADVRTQLVPPRQKPTFLAWHPTGRLLGGMPDGSILTWGESGPRYELVCRDHKVPVRAWATAAGTWDFATGDDKGNVGLWPDRATTPRAVFGGATAAIRDMAFSPCARYLALADADGRAWVWDLWDRRPVVKATRPDPVRAVAFGPNDDVVILGTGKAVELWHLPELAKLP